MKTEFLSELNIRLSALAVFRDLLNDPVIAALRRYLDCLETAGTAQAVDAYARFAAALYAAESPSLAQYIQSIVSDNENPYIRAIGRGERPSLEMTACVDHELAVLQTLAELTPEVLRGGIDWNGYLPGFAAEKVEVAASYRQRCENIGRYGYGIYARYRMFCIGPDHRITPVRSPDPVTLSALIDYKREQKIILDNTLALLEGKPAANILLTGDAGTGKSSTVKAIVNELHHRGLRILEVRKEQLCQLPGILDELSGNPLKFILFIDDLSFQKGDDNFSALKAILEGSVSARSSNVVIYATSNRRHLVKESFSDRDGDDIHRNDTVQELISLSERFGIHVTFQKPNKQTYLNIVNHLAQARGVQCAPEELELQAERFALERGGRSARAAAQFIDGLLAKS